MPSNIHSLKQGLGLVRRAHAVGRKPPTSQIEPRARCAIYASAARDKVRYAQPRARAVCAYLKRLAGVSQKPQASGPRVSGCLPRESRAHGELAEFTARHVTSGSARYPYVKIGC